MSEEPATYRGLPTLREALTRVLPDILPGREHPAMKGTAIIRRVQSRKDIPRFAAASIRYHLSIMSRDPSSPIEKCPDTQGYHLRPEADRKWSAKRTIWCGEMEHAVADLLIDLLDDGMLARLLQVSEKAEKLRAVLNSKPSAKPSNAGEEE